MATTEDVRGNAAVRTPDRLQKRGRSDRSLLARALDGPFLQPTSYWWESVAVFNPGVAEGPDGVIHFLYRAQGRDGIARLGYARSLDGETIVERGREPVFEPETESEFERFGTEDPRIVRLGKTYYVTYTAFSRYRATDPHPARLPEISPPMRIRVALAITEDFQRFVRLGVILPEMENKDAVLFPEKVGGEFVLLHRIPPDMWVATSGDLKHWREHRVVLRTRPSLWDERRLGAGPPPVRTEAGWLVCYHGVDHHNVYRAGFVLLDHNDPSVVLGRSVEPALEPETPWEVKGRVPRVIFPSGMILRGDQLLVYYGAADTVVGVARGSLKEILASLG